MIGGYYTFPALEPGDRIRCVNGFRSDSPDFKLPVAGREYTVERVANQTVELREFSGCWHQWRFEKCESSTPPVR